MKETPILFSGEMVRAILDGRKTQTRRVIKWPTPYALNEDEWCYSYMTADGDAVFLDEGRARNRIKCPYGAPGDELWVRETWRPEYHAEGRSPDCGDFAIAYKATNTNESCKFAETKDQEKFCMMAIDKHGAESWRPSIHMPRWASRITLEVKNVRVERVQDVSEKDAIAEGLKPGCSDMGERQWINPVAPEQEGGLVWAFSKLWDGINAKRGYGWNTNPWVWCIEFERIE